MEPLVSVIVIAHDRKKFLRFALDSLASQNVCRNLFEVIVVKNYEDIEVDNIARKEGFKCVLTNAESASDKLLLAYGISVGKILSFLEDDDLYLPQKIHRLIDIFSSNTNLGYYHNQYQIIRENHEVMAHFNSGEEFAATNRQIRSFSGFPNFRTSHKIVRQRGDFNISSIAVKREFLEQAIKKFGETLFGTDYYLFYFAISSGHDIVLDSAIMTKYRAHQGNASLATFGGGEMSEFIEARVGLFDKVSNQKKSLLKRLKDDSTAFGYLKFTMLVNRLDMYFLSRNFTKKDMYRDLLQAMSKCPKTDMKLIGTLFFFGLCNIVNKRIAQLFYFNIFFIVLSIR